MPKVGLLVHTDLIFNLRWWDALWGSCRAGSYKVGRQAGSLSQGRYRDKLVWRPGIPSIWESKLFLLKFEHFRNPCNVHHIHLPMHICKHMPLSLSQTLFLSDTSESPPGLPISHDAEHRAQWQNSLQSRKGAISPFFILSGWRSAKKHCVKVMWNVWYWNMLFPVDWLSVGRPLASLWKKVEFWKQEIQIFV